MIRAWPVPIFADNYVWILEKKGSSRVAVVDPGDGVPVIEALDARGLVPAAVIVTHHHRDHVGGLPELIQRFRPQVFGSAAESVAGVDQSVTDGDTVDLPDLGLALQVMALPGHTAGHVGYVGPGFAFVGDTLFAGGCGRVFEGTFEEMYSSLEKLAALPAETKIYCAHEYTIANLRFALAVEPGNADLALRLTSAEVTRAENQPTVPSTIGFELSTNPFLRCSEPAVVAAAGARVGRDLEHGAEVFGAIRSWKDGWSG